MKEFIEQQIIESIRKLLTGRVNELLGEVQFIVPIIEFGNHGCGYAASPMVALNTCERTEKERIIRLDAYSLTITFELPEMPESDLHCYAYAAAVCGAIEENPTLGGIADRTVVTGKKYNPPKKPGCGEGWGLVITLRLTVEGMNNAG